MSKMSSAGVTMTEFTSSLGVSDTELQTRNDQDATYVRLKYEDGEVDDLEMEEFELPLPDRISTGRKVLWWVKVLSAGVLLTVGGCAAVFWGAPWILDNVLIPMLVWEASTFSKPVLALVLVLSLALFPIVMLPSGPSMWLSGMIFGYGFGFLIIMVGTLFGQSFPYFIGRWLLHDRIQEFLLKRPKQAAVLKLAEQGSWFYQFRSIVIYRISPFPGILFNYAVTATNIGFGPYIAGSMAGMVPDSLLMIYTGKMIKDLANLRKHKLPITWPQMIYYIVSFAVVIGIGVAVAVLGRRALADLELREAAETATEEVQMRELVDE